MDVAATDGGAAPVDTGAVAYRDPLFALAGADVG